MACKRKGKAAIRSPQTPDRNSPSWRGARRLTHTWAGSAEVERIDATEAVWRALQIAARTGTVPVVNEPLGEVEKPF